MIKINIVLLTLISFAFQDKQFSDPPPNLGQLFKEESYHELKSMPAGFHQSFWPEELKDDDVVKASSFPKSLKHHVSKWITTIIRKEWLPKDMDQKWFGIKNLRNSEMVAIRYKADDDIIQILEPRSVFFLTIKLSETVSLNENIENTETFVKQKLLQFTNFPPEKIASVAFTWGFDKNLTSGSKLITGILEVETSKPIGEFTWWNRVWFTTDGETIHFTFSELPSEEKSPTGIKHKSRFDPDDDE